jgi:Putative lumazine-binding
MKKVTRLKAVCLFILSATFVAPVFSQKEEKAIKEVINHFFNAMSSGDTATLKSTCTETPVFQTFMKDKDGNMQVYTEDFNDFLKFVASPGKDKFKEEVAFDAIHFEASLASVWAPYTFFLNGKVSHCGTDSFQLVKTTEGWKIQYIIDTRRKTCK